MENSTHFSLKWNHFKDNFTSQFECLKQEEEFVDVTLSCQGKLFRAHKVILSAASPYLTALFKDNPCKHPVLILDDLPSDHLESLLSFIYTGAVSIPEAELRGFLESASTLQIRGLSEVLPTTPVKTQKRPSIEEPDTAPAKKKPTYEPKPEPTLPEPPEQTDFTPLTGQMETELPMTATTVDGRKQHSLDPRRCPICNRLYSNLSNLRQHLRLIHNPTIVTCKLCSKPFKTDLYLRRHLSSYHGENLSPDGKNSVGPPPFRETRSKLKTNLA